MTTTVVFATAGDGYLYSTNATYSTARAGSGVQAFPSVSAGFFGQNNNGGTYALFQTFLRFTYAAIPATDVLTSAAVQVRIASMLSPATNRGLEFRSAAWSAGGLTVADWKDGSALASTQLVAAVDSVNTAPVNSRTRAGSDLLRTTVAAGTSLELVALSSKHRSAIAPTTDEGGSFYLAGAAGTTNDPALILTTVPQSRLHGVLGASAQLSDETWAYLENTGAGVDLKHCTAAGVVSTVASLPIAAASGSFAPAVGAQAFALAADSSNNLYVTGRSGAGPGLVAILAYAKGAGYTWAATPLRTAALPFHPAEINQVAAAYAAVPTPIITVLAARTTGNTPGADTSDVSWVTFSTASLLTGTGSVPLAVGDANGIMDTTPPSGDFGGQRNEVGSGLDLAASVDNPGWVYGASFHRGQIPGDNAPQKLGRLVFDSAGTTLTSQSRSGVSGYGVKDASAKLRTVDAAGGVSAIVSADRDAGFGISVYLYQNLTPPNAPVPAAGISLAGESIASMPDGPAVGSALTWDAGYSAVENRLWIYYVDATNPLRVRRTPVSLNSYTATRQEITVYTAPAGSTIQAIRLPRGKRINARTLLQVAYANGGTNSLANVVDTYNVAPTPPTLAPRSGFDATQSAVLTWTFTDPNPGDTQSAYQLQIEDTAAPGVAVVDTGKVVSSVASRTLAGGTLANGKTYQWRVATWDALDAAGTYSGYGSFATAAGGTVTITNPAADNPPGLAADEYQVAWSVAGTTQAAYRVWLFRGATQVSDTNWVTSTAQTALVTGMLSDTQHEIRVQVRNSALVTSNVGNRLLTPSFGTPEVPQVTVTPVQDGGYILVSVDNPVPGQPELGAPFYSFDANVAALTPSAVTLTQSTEQAFRGTGSAKHVTTGAPAFSRITPAEAALLTVTAGQRYTAMYRVFSATPASFVAAIDWKPANPAGATISTATGSATTIPANTWTLIAATATAPTGAEHAVYGPWFSVQPATGYTFYVDDLGMVSASDRPEVATNEVYRRTPGGTWELLGTCGPDGQYRDYRAVSGVAYEYKVRGVS